MYQEVYKILKEENISEDAFLHLEKKYELILFGGAVRDYIFTGYQSVPRDMDFVVVGAKNNIELRRNLSLFWCNEKISQNQFEGIKVTVGKFSIDIWRLEDTLAFKKGFLPCSVDNLLESVTLNIDAYAYNMNTKKYVNKCNLKIYPQKIELMLKDEENLNLNLIRAIVYSEKYRIPVSKEIKGILMKKLLDEKEVKKINDIQIYHFKQEKININDLYNRLLEGNYD